MKDIKCKKCGISLEKLRADGIADYMMKAQDEKGEFFICRACMDGWTD